MILKFFFLSFFFLVGEQKLCPRPIFVNQILIKTRPNSFVGYFLLLFFKVHESLVFSIFKIVQSPPQ